MDEINTRLSKLEATQHFMLAVEAALCRVCMSNPELKIYLEQNLDQQLAILLAESQDELKIQTLQELRETLLGS